MGGGASKPQSENSEDSVFSLSNELQRTFSHLEGYVLYFLWSCKLTFYSQEQMIKEYNDEQIVKLFGKQIERLGEQKATLVKGANNEI